MSGGVETVADLIRREVREACEAKNSPSTSSGRAEGVLTDAPGDGPAKQAQVGTPRERLASPVSAGGAFPPGDVALIHALRAGSERVAVHAGQRRPVVLKGRPGPYGQLRLEALTGPEALALGLALVKAAMAVQP